MNLNKAETQRKAHAPLRVAVVGAGRMGQHHCRVYSMLNNVKLVGILDIDSKRAEQTAAQYRCQVFKRPEDLIGKVDAVSIAAPSQFHFELGEYFLNHQIHCLIEKPLAITENECLKLIHTAETKNLILLVGHVERFNPALQTMAAMLKNMGQIYAIDAKRLGWNINRFEGIDVVLDLMVHDFEIISFLLNDAELVDIHGHGTNIQGKTETLDHVHSILKFSTGTIAQVTASWMTSRRVRSLEVNTEAGNLVLDYYSQNLSFYPKPPLKLNLPSDLSNQFQCDEKREQIFVRYQEPLMLELMNFIQSIEAGVPMGVNGYQALNALQVAWKLENLLKKDSSLSAKTAASDNLSSSTLVKILNASENELTTEERK